MIEELARERLGFELASCDSGTFVFLSPEQLANGQTRQALQRARPGLFVVDEAHRLGLQDPVVVIGDFDRPGIRLSARHVRTVADKQQALSSAAREFDGPGIVYAATHASAQRARDTLASSGENMTLYHAGLPARERHDAMAAFLDGSARVIAATVAFGMGIDKADVRWVVHADPTPSLDEYYQEFGRAGRDDAPAQARLLFRYEDFDRARRLTARGVSGDAVAWVRAS